MLTYPLSLGPPGRRASFGAVTPENAICFSGGGAPESALIITESPDKI